MKTMTPVVVLLAAAGLFVGVRPATPQPPAAPQRPPVLAPLRVGQAVTLKQVGGLHTVSTLDGIEAGTHTVVEVGPDYLAVKDIAGLTETRIPVTAVSAVVRSRLPAK